MKRNFFMNEDCMFFENIRTWYLRKTKATEVINFGSSKPEKEKLISSKKTFIDFKDSMDQKENIN